MNIETKFSCGDKAWCIVDNDKVSELTVGQVRVEITDSQGVNGGRVNCDCDIAFDNYKPQKNYVESYMMAETGIGTGRVYTLGVHVFQTEAEALAVLNYQKATAV